ncbi:hypothetical protein [Pseudomonas chlororaphis]|uniref:hypothetical protein n=1 Tax=Pseudomonas chlororaphis TaxID=587753 RepID=UPI002365574D|nr:hypothetical protein [Pseudomonas chlororaphis]WDG52374.1 hypothetical protein PUP76_21220 [Pseudomonas chlororaphis]WDH86609.1 hypothetical protein PUP74_20965 [Pseudomonas chlororaphis]
MARFVAIPVGQGDAFYLERENFSVLVDGGKGRRCFADLFMSTVDRQSVNVIVCTHNDADHIRGLLGYLDSTLHCDELWLPAQWLTLISGVLHSPSLMHRELMADIERFCESYTAFDEDADAPLDSMVNGKLFLNRQEERPRHTEQMEPSENDIRWFQEEREGLSDSRTRYTWLRSLHRMRFACGRYGRYRASVASMLHFGTSPSVPVLALYLEALEDLRNIAELLILALQRNIPVRWFEFSPNSPGGGRKDLIPVNAREVVAARSSNSTFTELCLSKSNRESLVFYSPADSAAPGVLFNADSNLKGIAGLSSFNFSSAIATVPHHGSEANANVYTIVNSLASVGVTWVRSDGRFRKRPCNDYINMQEKRFCTLCRPGTAPYSHSVAMEFYSGTLAWLAPAGQASCSCH